MATGNQVILLKDLKAEQLCPKIVWTIERYVEKIICWGGKKEKCTNSDILVSITEQFWLLQGKSGNDHAA